MPFMEPEIVYGEWIEIEGPGGTEWIPSDLAPEVDDYEGETIDLEDAAPNLVDYASQGRVWSIETRDGWGVRMSAAGYLDATDWTVFDTEEEAQDFLDEEMEYAESEEEMEAAYNPSRYDDDEDDIEELAELREHRRKLEARRRKEARGFTPRGRRKMRRRRDVEANEAAAPYALEIGGERVYIQSPTDFESAKRKLQRVYSGGEADLLKLDRASGEWEFVRKVRI